MFDKRIERRSFLKGAAGALAFPYVVSSAVLGRGRGAIAPSNKIVVGAIGVGPQGTGVMGNFLRQKDARDPHYQTTTPRSSHFRRCHTRHPDDAAPCGV